MCSARLGSPGEPFGLASTMRRPIALSRVSSSSMVVNFEARTTAWTSAAVARATFREPVICLRMSLAHQRSRQNSPPAQRGAERVGQPDGRIVRVLQCQRPDGSRSIKERSQKTLERPFWAAHSRQVRLKAVYDAWRMARGRTKVERDRMVRVSVKILLRKLIRVVERMTTTAETSTTTDTASCILH